MSKRTRYSPEIRERAPGRTQVNIIKTMKREHSKKPDELYPIIETCKCEKLLVARYRGNSAQQMGKHGRNPSRESVVVFRRP